TLSSALCLVLCLHISFFFNDTATPDIYPLSLHDALPILPRGRSRSPIRPAMATRLAQLINMSDIGVSILESILMYRFEDRDPYRSEEHTSELQSLTNLVCRLLLEKKKK